jgi:N-ethylmaleimide reductase
MGDSDPLATFSYVVKQLEQRHIAFIFTRESLSPNRISPELKKLFSGVFIANEGFNPTTAKAELASGEADAISFGKDFIANPDLPRRLQLGVALNSYHAETFYGAGAQDPTIGYTDYPSLLAEVG